MKTAIGAILAIRAKRILAGSAAIVGVACSQGSASETSADGGLVNCPPIEYISSGVCTSLPINGLPDAAAWMNDPGPDESEGAAANDARSEAAPDASVVDGSSGGDADAVDSSSLPSGSDLDALDLDVQCETGTAVPVCVEYFAAILACTGQDFLSAACEEGLVETPDADVASIEALCEGNLQALGCM
jgi:hypothetical protein